MSTKIRGNTQIMDYTIDLGRLEQDFLNGSDWDITNGNQDAGVRGVRLTPLYDDELTSKYYVDSLLFGVDWKESAQFTTKTNIAGAVYTSTGGTGGTGAFTNVDLTSSTIFDFGSHSVTVNDRVLIKNQTDQKQNGIYIVTSTGSAGGLERAPDHDGQPGSEVSGGNAIFVENGSTYAKTGWVLQGDGALTLNTDNLIWVQFSGVGTYIAGDALNLTGNQFDVLYDDTTIGLDGSNQLEVKTDGINDSHIDWGSGANQVNATDVPLDTGGTYGGSAINVQDALEELESSQAKFTTIDAEYGTDPIASTTSDTLTLRSSTGEIVITGNAGTDRIDFSIANDGIKDYHIDWGTGSNQVSAGDIPVDTTNFDGILSGSDSDIQTALETIDDHDHSGSYPTASFTTIDAEFGTDPVADSITDTLVLKSSSGIVVITGNATSDTIDFDIAADSINDTHIDWGTGANQVSAVDVPIADSGNYFTPDNVEAALQALAAVTPGFGVTRVWGEAPTVTHNNPTVTLANTPVAGTDRVYLNGLRQEKGSGKDYTISGATITFTFNLKTSPGQSDVVLVDYEY